ncbi:MAG: DMT family transporter [Christensenellales bacterium]|jgi:transporter family-2 protein
MVVAIIVSLLAGFTIVASRMINSNLAERTSLIYSTIWNYISGIILSAVLLLLFGLGETAPFSQGLPKEFWILFGGGLGAVVVFLSNLTVTKVSALNLTLLMFVGQIFASILLDWVISGAFSLGNTLGGVFVAAGMGFNLWVDRDNARKKEQRGIPCKKTETT